MKTSKRESNNKMKLENVICEEITGVNADTEKTFMECCLKKMNIFEILMLA